MRYVYDFDHDHEVEPRSLSGLLGGKGANLAEMSNLGLPVPPGFTITTEACRFYLEQGRITSMPIETLRQNASGEVDRATILNPPTSPTAATTFPTPMQMSGVSAQSPGRTLLNQRLPSAPTSALTRTITANVAAPQVPQAVSSTWKLS